MRAISVLSIGNSFSNDAHRYLYGIAKADGCVMDNVNLYIGGCSLEHHFRNVMNDAKEYGLEYRGEATGFFTTVKEALLNRSWDVVTVQQASPSSVDYATYQPYLNRLVDYIRECCPKAKTVLHMTWAYQNGYERMLRYGFPTSADMFKKVKSAYLQAAEEIKPDAVIYAGELINRLIESGADPLHVHRDGFHLGLGLGRYAVALLWYQTLTGRDISENAFRGFDESISEEEIALAKKLVGEMK